MKKYFDSDGNELNFGDIITISHNYVHKGVRYYTKITRSFNEKIAKTLVKEGFITEKEVKSKKEKEENTSTDNMFSIFNDILDELVKFFDESKQENNKRSTK